MIGVQIKPNQEVKEIDTEPGTEFAKLDNDGYSLVKPEVWEHLKKQSCLLKTTLMSITCWPPS